jgi:hypothetical protein
MQTPFNIPPERDSPAMGSRAYSTPDGISAAFSTGELRVSSGGRLPGLFVQAVPDR